MKIALSDEQRLLLETAQSFFSDRAPIQKSRENIETDFKSSYVISCSIKLSKLANTVRGSPRGRALARAH